MGMLVSFLFGSLLKFEALKAVAENCILYRLELGASVCFVRVTGDSNNLLYRLEKGSGPLTLPSCVRAGRVNEWLVASGRASAPGAGKEGDSQFGALCK